VTNATQTLPFALPDIGEEEIAEVVDVLRSGWITSGPRVERFEAAFREALGAGHALAVNSATSGLHLALEAIGIGPGDEVITTPYTFTATAEAIRYLGADPVFVDIDARTFNIDPAGVADALEKDGRARALLPVHIGGQACDMQALLDLAGEFDVRVVEDAAHAFPAAYGDRAIGTLGDVTVFSFYATKTITTGDGGMVVTDDPSIADRMRLMRLHGIDRTVHDRRQSTRPSWYYEVLAPGFKYNMTDIAAALGIHQLAKAERFRKRREEIALRYTEAFEDLPARTPCLARVEDQHAWHLYVLQLEIESLRVSRDRFSQQMLEQGVETSVHFIPLHLQPYWRDRYGLEPEDFPVAHDVYRRAVSLPIYSRMTDADVDRVISVTRTVLAENLEG